VASCRRVSPGLPRDCCAPPFSPEFTLQDQRLMFVAFAVVLVIYPFDFPPTRIDSLGPRPLPRGTEILRFSSIASSASYRVACLKEISRLSQRVVPRANHCSHPIFWITLREYPGAVFLRRFPLNFAVESWPFLLFCFIGGGDALFLRVSFPNFLFFLGFLDVFVSLYHPSLFVLPTYLPFFLLTTVTFR